MTLEPSEEQELASTLTRLGHPTFEVKAGMDDVLMLYVSGHLICGALYALSMTDEQVGALVDETLAVVDAPVAPVPAAPEVETPAGDVSEEEASHESAPGEEEGGV